MNKELLANIRNILIPTLASHLKKTNYEGQGEKDAIEFTHDMTEIFDLAEQQLSAQPKCEDAVPRTSVEYIIRKNTVSTNPDEHKYYDKFIQFMDDPEISDFGRWQHSNGFNTALVAVKCDLDKVPSVTPKKWKGKVDR